MCNLCVFKIWRDRQWPTDLGRAVFIPLSKKGNINKEWSNYRIISLICDGSKAKLKILNNRMKRKLENEIARRFWSWERDQGSQSQYQKHHRGHSTSLYLCFIDFSKTFDCVPGSMEHHERYGIPNTCCQ